MRAKLAVLGAGLALSCTACALVVSFGGYDVSPSPPPEGGAGDEVSTVGFRLEATPASLSLARDIPQTIQVVAVRDPGFTDPIAFDMPSSSVASLTVHVDAGVNADTISATVASSVAVPQARLSFSAHASGRTQTLDVDAVVRGGSGDLDPQFADGGAIIVPEISDLFGIVLDGTGRIIVGVNRGPSNSQEGVLRRWTSTGQPDLSFGDGGTVLVVPAGNHPASSLSTSSRGFLVAGQNIIYGLLANGARDVGFGDGGMESTDVTSALVVNDDAASAILVGLASAADEFLGHRVLAAGTFDKNYADAGTLDLGASGGAAHLLRCARVVGGKLLVADTYQLGSDNSSFGLVEVTEGGFVDTTFGDAGRLLISPVTISGCGITAEESAVVNDGQTLYTLGRSGISEQPFTFLDLSSVAVGEDPSGRIVVAGQHANTVAVFRFLADGAPDPSFRSGTSPIGVVLPQTGSVSQMAIQPDGAIIIAASIQPPSPYSLFIARILP